ncbi:MAG: ROK family protein [Eubacteriales bacterium]|nr:ROK family protein [Eubacteriales bacterium]
MKAAQILALDIGGTAAKFGYFDLEPKLAAQSESKPELRGQAELQFSGDREQNPLLQQIADYLPAYLEHAKASGLRPEEIFGLAISATGQIDSKAGVVAGTCGNFPGWLGSPLKDFFESYFNCPCTVANDANCMVLGEAWQGRGRAYQNIIGITLGTGVGGGIIVNGRILEGQRGLAGELGHIPLYGPAGRDCSCPLHGCVEQYIATSSLLRRAQEAAYDFKNAKELCAALFAGPADSKLEELWAAWILDIAYSLAGLVHIFNPECILIGGGISEQGERLLGPLREQLKKLIMPEFAKGLVLEAAALGNQAGLYGALKYFLDSQKEREN